MPGLLDLIASNSSSSGSGSEGLGGFFNSPIAMVLMPRTAARFQEVQHQNFLMQQVQRKNEFAMKFAQSIAKTDPMSAAAIMADPSNIDNVLSMYNAKTEWNRQHGITQEDEANKQQRQHDLDIAKIDHEKSILDPAVKQYQEMESGLVQGAVAPTGKMADPRIEGPRPAGQLQQGQDLSKFTPANMDLITGALAKQTGIDDLTHQEALDILRDPTAMDRIQKARDAIAAQESTQDFETTKILGERSYKAKLVKQAQAAATDISTKFFGEEPTAAPDSVATQTLKWREYFQDPNITPSQARRLTTAFAGGLLVTDNNGTKTPDPNAALAKANEQYNKMNPATAKLQTTSEPGTTFYKYTEKDMGAVVKDALVAGQDAADQAAKLTVLKNALKSAPQGVLNPGALIASYVHGYSGAADTVDSIIQGMAPSVHKAGTGSQSDLEFSSALRSLPQLLKTPEGNQVIIAMAEAKNQLQRDQAKVAADMISRRISYQDGVTKMNELNQKSLVTPEVQAALKKAGIALDPEAERKALQTGSNTGANGIPEQPPGTGLTAEEWAAGSPDTWAPFLNGGDNTELDPEDQ